jgi:hypothetical protein
VVSSRVVRVAGLLIGAAALVLALLPFTTSFTLHDISGAYPPVPVSCGPPVVEATRAPSRADGWFGYAPLTAAPASGFSVHACHEPARHRLIGSAIGFLIAALLGWWSARLAGDIGVRRRWPEPV